MNKKAKKRLNIVWKVLLVIVITGAVLARRFYREKERDMKYNKQMDFARKAAEYQKKYQDSLYRLGQKERSDSAFNARKKAMDRKMKQLEDNIKKLENDTISK